MQFNASQGLQTVLVMMAFNAVATGLKKGVDYLKAGQGTTAKGFFLAFISGALEFVTANTAPQQPPKKEP